MLRWLVLAVAIGMALPARANAGAYVVHSCALPDGSPAPIDGWTYQWNYVAWSGWGNTCQSPTAPERAIKASIARGNPPIDTISRWTFTAPPDTTLQRYVMYRHMTSSQADGTVRSVYVMVDGRSYVDACFVAMLGCTESGTADPTARFSSTNAVTVEDLNARALTVNPVFRTR